MSICKVGLLACAALFAAPVAAQDLVHEPISPPERFGHVSVAPTLEAVLEQAGVPHRGPLPKPQTSGG